MKIADGYDPGRPKETVGSDWALVSLDKSLGSEGRVLSILSEPPENGAKVVLGGYQKDYPLLLMADDNAASSAVLSMRGAALIAAQLRGNQWR